jgi:4-amino-4-deoxy-L-arabinose transferase-like glycosyltransferase
LAVVLHHLFGYLGHYGFDDMEYARVAARLANGEFDAGNHYSFRITLVGLTALSYKLFGINDWASALPPLIFFIGTLVLIYSILKDESGPILTIGLALFSLNNWTFFYSDKLMPDGAVTFFAFLFCYAIYSYRYLPRKMPELAYSLLAALALFLCFNSKETVVLLAPLVAWLMVADIVQKRSGRFWLQFVGFSLVMLACYLVVCQVAFGNAITRFNAIVANSYLNSCSYDQLPFSETLKRITFGLAKLFLTQDMILGFLVVLLAFFFIPVKQILKLSDRKSFFIVSSVVLMFSANFMSISVTSYIPMCADPRHYLFIVPVVAVAAALILKDYLSLFRFRIGLFVLVSIAFGLSLFFRSATAYHLYLPVLVAIGCVVILKNTVQVQNLFAILLFVALLFQPADMFIYASNVNYEKQKEIVQRELIGKNKACVVITDEVQKRLGNYYEGFSLNAACQFINYAEADTFHFQKNAKIMLLNNWYTRYLSGMDDQDMPAFATTAVNPVFKDEKLNLDIFELNGLGKGQLLFSTENDYESSKEYWSQSSSRSSVHAHSGSFSEKAGEFSAICSFPLDTLFTDSITKLTVFTKLQIFAANEAECNLVVSIESNGEQYFWQGFNLSKYVKSKGSWWLASNNLVIDKSAIRKNSMIKIYIWNNKKNEIYIDDFKVELFLVSK